jgi:hypothetical protein
MNAQPGVSGNARGKATIEHLNREGPFYWPEGLEERHLVIACGQCNSSRGRKRLIDWFESAYCAERGISARTVCGRGGQYLRTALAKR